MDKQDFRKLKPLDYITSYSQKLSAVSVLHGVEHFA
jgi:hypothetical protein